MISKWKIKPTAKARCLACRIMNLSLVRLLFVLERKTEETRIERFIIKLEIYKRINQKKRNQKNIHISWNNSCIRIKKKLTFSSSSCQISLVFQNIYFYLDTNRLSRGDNFVACIYFRKKRSIKSFEKGEIKIEKLKHIDFG